MRPSITDRPAHLPAVENDDEPNERELVERARRDPEAFAVIYRKHVNGIRNFAYRRCGDPHVADDITAIVFERAWRYLPTLKVQDYGIAPWLYRIAANELASHFRKRFRGDRATAKLAAIRPQDPVDPADHLERRHDIDEVRAALGRLRPRHQEVITLRYLAGLTPQETAEVMESSPSVVAAVLHRALKALESVLDDERKGGDEHGTR